MKTFSIIYVVIFLSSVYGYTQPNWDFVNFPSSSQSRVSKGACIDTNDHIYALEMDTNNGQFSVAKYDNGVQSGNSFALPNGLFFPSETFNHISFGNSKVYVAGRNSTGGIIYEIDTSLGSSNSLPIISSTNGWVILNGITIKNDELFVVGNLSLSLATSSNVTFGNLPMFPISQNTGFVAKFSLATNNWVWVKKVLTPSYGSVEDVAIDTSGKIYITGKFKNSLTVYDSSSTPHTFSNTTEHNYLLRFNSNGDYDPVWGLKQNYSNGNEHRTFDVKVDPDNTAVYYISRNKILKHDILSSGNLIWTKSLQATAPGVILIFQIVLNNCDEIYATGRTGTNVLRTQCGSDFFAIGANKTTGVTSNNWASNATSSVSNGAAILIDSDNKVNVVGTYGNTVCPEHIVIDNNSPPSHLQGTFIGKIDDYDYNSCCPSATAAASFINPNRTIQMASKYGPIDVSVLCLSNDLLVDGSASTCEDRYFIGLADFNLATWSNNLVLHSDWVHPLTQAPSSINILDFIPQGYQLRPGIVYKFRLAVGNPWDATDIWFMIDCCSNDPVLLPHEFDPKKY